MERLDKLLVSCGAGSRKEVQKLIRRGEVSVNGEVCRSPERKVAPEADKITACGQAVNTSKHVYIMLNKPSGVVSATEDKTEKTVLDILPGAMKRPGLFPAGRLDKDTEGLLIITDDGGLAHRMLSPKKHVVKRYAALLDGEITDETVRRFGEGIELRNGERCLPAKLEIPDPDNKRKGLVSISEGKYHQVKRMFSACGLKVVQLERISIGGLYIDSKLNRGEARFLTNLEIEAIFFGNMHENSV